jgi:hypothetical protein
LLVGNCTGGVMNSDIRAVCFLVLWFVLIASFAVTQNYIWLGLLYGSVMLVVHWEDWGLPRD